MFRSALFKLTAVYVILTLLLSLMFSLVFYQFAEHELNEGLHHQYSLLVDNDHDADNVNRATGTELTTRSAHLERDLIYFNIVVFIGSIALALFLASRTLRPIEIAHESQIRFTAEASHELRTPISAMKADTESILGERRPTYKQLHDTLKSNLSDIQRLERLTNHLLYMGRFKSQKTTESPTSNVSKGIESSISLAGRQYKEKDIRPVLEIEDVNVKTEQIVLEQLLTIIVGNAYKYSKKKGTVTINAKSTAKNVHITVSDTGRGIPSQDLPHIFEHFYRSSNSQGPYSSGHGLGLPLAKNIVSHYGGEIIITSNKTSGTKVDIRLPKAV